MCSALVQTEVWLIRWRKTPINCIMEKIHCLFSFLVDFECMGPQRQQVLASHDSTCGALAAWAAQGVSWRTVSLCQTSRAHQATWAQVPSSRVPLLALSPVPKPHAWWSRILEKCWGATTCGNSWDGTGHGFSQLCTYILQGCMGTTKAFFAQTEAWQLFVVLIHTWTPRQVWQEGEAVSKLKQYVSNQEILGLTGGS